MALSRLIMRSSSSAFEDSNSILPEQHSGTPVDEAANRLGSWSGLMAESGHATAADSFVPGDLKTARLFGRHVAQTLVRIRAAA